MSCIIPFALSLVGLAPSAQASHFDTIAKQIESQQVTSVEALLPLLPESLRSKYVLVFHSRSLQGASPAEPRVILFDKEAKFMAAFNGNPNQRGFQDFEIAEYDDEKKQFFYREILFPNPAKKRTLLTISEANPPKCLKCHGEPVRPIWDVHPSWPGAYGQTYHAALSAVEQAGLKSFLVLQPTHPRYKFLKNVDTFAKSETFAPNTQSRYEGHDHHIPPNATLSVLLGNLNFQIMAHEVTEAADFKKFQYLLLAALDEDCRPLESFVPPELKERVAADLAHFSKDSMTKDLEQERWKSLRANGGLARDAVLPSSEKVELNAFRFFVERGLGISTDGWTLALEKGTYDFGAPNSAVPSSTTKVLENLVSNAAFAHDSELKHVALNRGMSSEDRYCDTLRAKARATTITLRSESVTSSRFPASDVGQPVLLQRCASCHDGTVAKSIPFNDPDPLALALQEGGHRHGTLLQEILYRLSPDAGFDRMPRGLNLSTAEQNELETYFQKIASSVHK